jgi:hypothetical protein
MSGLGIGTKLFLGFHLLVSYLFIAIVLRGVGKYLDSSMGKCAFVLVGLLFAISWYISFQLANASYIARLRRTDRSFGQ